MIKFKDGFCENEDKKVTFHLEYLGKGSKIKLIIFVEFSANGGGVPPIRENN